MDAPISGTMDAPVAGRTASFRETCLMARDQYAQDVAHHEQQLADARAALEAAEAAIETLNRTEEQPVPAMPDRY